MNTMNTEAPRPRRAGSIYLEPCREGVIDSVMPCPEAVDATRRRGGIVLATAILGSAMAFIDGTVVNVALPIIQSDLGAGTSALQWIVESYALLLAALLLVGGALGDHFGRRRIYLIGIVIFGLASLACGLSSTTEALIIARAVQGVGAALLVPGSLALIGANFPPEKRGAAIGTWSAATAITTALGPVLGGWLAQAWSWHWIFFLNLPLVGAVLVLGLWGVPESRNEEDQAPLDWLGAGLSVAGLGGLTFGLIEASRLGLGDPLVYGSGLAGLGCLVLFVLQQIRRQNGMVPPALFRSRAFTGTNLMTFLLYMALSGVLFFLPLKLIQVDGYSAPGAAAAFLPFVVIMFFFSRYAGRLMDVVGPRLPLVAGPLVTTVGFVLLGILAGKASYWLGTMPAILVVGAGMTLTVSPLTATVMGSVSDSLAGTASGINNAVSRVGALIAIALFSLIVIEVSSTLLMTDLRAALPDLGDDVLRKVTLVFGSVEVPASLLEYKGPIEDAGRMAFLQGFQAVCALAALFSLLSAGLAARFLPSGNGFTTG